ncbi:MAG: serine/threonine-protein kinase [Myxococcota bacterium]
MDDNATQPADESLPACPYCGQTHPEAVLKCTQTDMPLPLTGRLLSGKFRFIRRLGKGGMASVWLAVNEAVDREVAIKLIRPEVLKSEDLVARFRSEAKAAGRIDHPNICEILDFGLGPVGPYIVMESLRGQTLAQIIKARRALPPAEALDLVLEALDGLQAAHDAGIVHRDLKPENVFLHEPTIGDPVVKLMDFGVAKFTDGSAEITTEHGALLGTPEYMAPEQFKGADLAEPRTDVWAVGAILYRALTGKHAFKGPTVAATLLMVTHDEPTPIQTLRKDVPSAVVEVIQRCMSKAVTDRYDSVASLRDALQTARGALDDEATSPVLPVVSADVPTRIDGYTPTDLPDGPDAPPAPLLTPPASNEPESEEPTHASDHEAPEPEIERRPTEAYRVQPAPNRTPLLVGVAAVGLAALAFALWPREPSSDPEPVQAAGPTEARATTAAPTPADPPDQPLPPPPEPERPPADPDPEPVADTDPAPEDPAEVDDPVDPADPPEDTAEVVEDAPAPTQPIELPPGVVDLGNGYVLAKQRGKRSDHGEARKFCEALALTGHEGIDGWKLPFPDLVKRIRDAKSAPKGQYWTSARWRGNVTTFKMPSGDMRKGVNADRKAARALCVAPFRPSGPAAE